MYKLRVSPAILENRLDCSFYNPVGLQYTELLRTNSDLRSLSDLVDPARTITNGVRGPDWQQTKYKLIRLQDCDNWIVNFEEAASISLEQFQENRRCRLKVNDIVVAIGGYIGNAAVLTEDCLAVIGQHSAVLPEPEKQGIDSRYLLAFLNSKIAEAIFCRYVSGTVQAGINLEDFRQLPAPVINAVAQKYIGDKVRQAEQLRAWAKRSENLAIKLFNRQIYWSQEALTVRKINKISASELDGRLDLKYNSPARLALLRHIKNKKIRTTELVRLVDISAMIGWKGLTTEYYTNFGPWLLRGIEFRDGVIEFEKLVSIDRDKYLEQPQIHLKEGDIAFSKDGTIGKAIVIPELANEMAAGSTIARLRPKEIIEINPYYLELALNHDVVQVQVESFATGVAQPHITQEWIAQLLIPRIIDEQAVGRYLKIHHQANSYSKILFEVAKTLVESLIEGQLTEQQLIKAQQALEDGDNSVDQAILSKLSAKGYAIEGAPPLFRDIDELYRLLEDAAQDEAEE